MTLKLQKKKLKTTKQKAKVQGKIDLLARAIFICAVNLPVGRSLLMLFFWPRGLFAGTVSNRTRPRRSRGAGLEKTEYIGVKRKYVV